MLINFTYIFCSATNEKGEEIFCWTDSQVSFVKGAFYYGYMVLQLPGGRLAELWGTKFVLGWSIFIQTVLTLVTPVAARTSVWMLVIIRVLVGLAQGVLFPSINPLMIR